MLKLIINYKGNNNNNYYLIYILKIFKIEKRKLV